VDADGAGEGQLVLVDVEGDDAGWSARGGSRIADAMQPVGALNGARANLVGMAVFHLLTIGAAAWLSIYNCSVRCERAPDRLSRFTLSRRDNDPLFHRMRL
jgi:hypothetical protein